mgnify:CR=1 FL=1
MKIYTKTGDEGDTSLFGGGRVRKSDMRVEAYGTVDELNSFVGLALAEVSDPSIRDGLVGIQHDLFALGASLATPARDGERPTPHTPELPAGRIEEMERWMDAAAEELPPLREFILPGGSRGAAALHVCRAVCRRAERTVVQLNENVAVEPGVVPYLNRLSDLFFVWARLENLRTGRKDELWAKE